MSSGVPSMNRAAAILLAAGDSTRMGSAKALIEWRGRPLLLHQVDRIRESRVDECIVVLGRDAESLEPLVRSAAGADRTTRSIPNPRHAEGKCSSILAGLAALTAAPAAIFIVSVDQPLAALLLDALLEAAGREWSGAGGRTILIPAFHGRRGHPPLFQGSLLPELLSIHESTEGLKAVVRRQPDRVLELPWEDDQILLNLNAGIDLKRASDI
jgi:molybdenum cofactor cytidylyltransferase